MARAIITELSILIITELSILTGMSNKRAAAPGKKKYFFQNIHRHDNGTRDRGIGLEREDFLSEFVYVLLYERARHTHACSAHKFNFFCVFLFNLLHSCVHSMFLFDFLLIVATSHARCYLDILRTLI